MEYTVWKNEEAYRNSPVPVIYLHSFRGNGEDVWKACHGLKGCPPMVLVSVNNPGTGLDDELSPWPAEGVWKGQSPYKGLAAEHLHWMMEECVPQVEAEVSRFILDTQGSQANGDSNTRSSDANAGGTGKTDNAGKAERTNAAYGTTVRFLPVIAGYSLAGLFALWAAWDSGYFRRAGRIKRRNRPGKGLFLPRRPGEPHPPSADEPGGRLHHRSGGDGQVIRHRDHFRMESRQPFRPSGAPHGPGPRLAAALNFS